MLRSTRWFVSPLALYVIASVATPLVASALDVNARPADRRSADAGAIVGGLRSLNDEMQADSLYRSANEALSRGEYRQAATLFRRVADRFPKTSNAANALYFQAFALSKAGGSSDLRGALEALARLETNYASSSANRGDASSLRIRVCGELARQGDESCARQIATRAGSQGEQQTRSCPREDDENDERIMALNALLNMSSDLALPLLETVLAKRDECSVALRKKAVFLVSNKGRTRAVDILLRVAKEDPNREVREQAIFWLGNTRDPRVVDMLLEMVEKSNDAEIQEKAIFSLSNTGSDRARQALRDIAGRESAGKRAREQAIFWLGNGRGQESADFLRGLYGRLNDSDLKQKVIFSLAQMRGVGNDKWLLDLAVNEREDVEMRKQALFWAGNQGLVAVSDLAALYDRMKDREMKDQIIFVLTQRRGTESVDKLMDIARRDPDRELRSKAIFWLGQSRDPRVLKFLEELINK